jgi:hypothetical protein
MLLFKKNLTPKILHIYEASCNVLTHVYIMYWQIRVKGMYISWNVYRFFLVKALKISSSSFSNSIVKGKVCTEDVQDAPGVFLL